MLQRRPTAPAGIVEYGTAEDRVDIPSARGPVGTAGRSAGILQILWRRKWIMVCCAIVAVGAGIVYLSQATKIYSAGTQIYIQQQGSQIWKDQSGGLNFMNYLQTQCDVIRSTTVVQEALKYREMNQAKSLEASENPTAVIKLATLATVGQKSDIITITAESPYPEDAAIFANAVRDAYIDYEQKMHRSTAAEIVTALEKEKQTEDADWKTLTRQMVEFKRLNGEITFEGDRGNIVLQRLEGLSSVYTQAQIEAMNMQVQADLADGSAGNPAKLQMLMQTSGMRGLEGGTALRSEVGQMEIRLNDLKSSYGPGYPQVASLERQVERLRAEAADADKQAADAYLAALHQQASAAAKKRDEMKHEFDIQKTAAMELNAKAADYAQLSMALTRNEKVLDFLDTRIKEFQITRDNDEPNSISTLETAKTPDKDMPARPLRAQVLAIALAIGLMAGLGAALLLDWMDHRIRSAAEVESLLGLPILGAVPHMLGKRSPIERGQEIHLYPKSEVAESYRTIRTGIRFGITDASSKTLLVTSPSPGDGKTTVASNLAIAIAQTGKRVLLVDADCRRPMVQRIYSLKEDIGLSSVLTGESELAASIQHSSTDNLDILPCGPLPPNPAEMLNSEAFTSLLRELSTQYDQVVVDSPPVAPVTDARILAAACDATVLVIRAEKTSRRVAEHARDALASVGAVLLGVVVNDAPRSRSEASSYGHYSYSYGYGYGSKGTNGRSKEIKAISVSTPASVG
jgi:capsular exopolysaccharide synthesis family protein